MALADGRLLAQTVSMLAAHATGPDARAFEAFWHIAHSPGAMLDGWRVALWFAAEPARLPAPKTRHAKLKAIAAWPADAEQPTWVSFPLDDLAARPELVRRSSALVLARRDVPREVERALNVAPGFPRSLAGQRSVRWLGPGESPKAVGRSRIALLLDPDNHQRALLLADVNDRFVVLSHRALYSYTFGPALASGEARLVMDDERGAWIATLDKPASALAVKRDFGPDAAARLSPAGEAVVIRLNQAG